MAQSEFERRPSPENGNVRNVDSAELMRDNPAALIVNNESYQRMVAHFSPEQFDPPQVVKVATYSSEHGETVRTFVVDGLTRTKYIFDHRDEIARDHPDFKFRVRDVTDSLLENPLIVPFEEKAEDQQALTMLQYLRAVVAPTREHSEIASDRIAAHLINGWQNMVGEDIARKYTALAALDLLADSRVPTATDDMLSRFLASQNEIMASESTEERVRLQRALIEMAAIIRQARLFKQEVARSAFILVSAESSTIGGEREARRQIYGLLHIPEVDKKLSEAFPEVGVIEQMRERLGQLISETFLKRFSNRPDRQQIISVLGDVLRNPSMNYQSTVSVFTSESPIEKYDEMRREINKDRIVRELLTASKRDQLTEIESLLVDRLGKVAHLPQQEIPSYIAAIRSAYEIYGWITALQRRLTEERDDLLRKGVRAKTIDTEVPGVIAARESLLQANSVRSLINEVGKLRDTIREVERRMQRDMTFYRIGTVTDEIFGEELHKGYGRQVRENIISYIFREVDVIDETQMRRRLAQLKSLDQDLQYMVVRGEMRVSRALQVMIERRRVVTVASTPAPAGPVEVAAIEEKASVEEAVIGIPQEHGVKDQAELEEQEEQMLIDKKMAEERRIVLGNEKLLQLVRSFRERLRTVDLERDELLDEVKRGLYEMFREAGRFVSDYDPIRVLQEDYPSLLENNNKLRAALLHREEGEASEDKLTSR